MTTVLACFVGYLVLVIGIGLWAARRSEGTQEDYFLGGRKLSALVTALSAVTSGRSSWLLIGVTGSTWLLGYSAVWYFPGYVLAELALFLTVGKRLRERSAALGALTIPEVLAKSTDSGPHGHRGVRRVAGAVVVLFLTAYTGAQLVAGGKALESVFAIDGRSLGLGLTAGIVLFYTLVGGYRAVALTDVLQAGFMLCGLVLLPILGLAYVGGVGELHARLQAIDPNLVQWSGGALALVGGLGIGLGSFGNPHILVRAMAIRSADDMRRAAWIGFFWNVVMAAGAFGIGLVGRALYPELADLGGDREHVYTTLGAALSERYLFAGFIGVLLAALFASIMSTCDSQLLVIASSLVRDFRGDSEARGTRSSRATVVVVLAAAIALVLADPDGKAVGPFVLYSWAALGAAFGPPLAFALFGRDVPPRAVLAGMVTGSLVVVVWASVPFLDDLVYELPPAFAASTLAVAALRGGRRAPA